MLFQLSSTCTRSARYEEKQPFTQCFFPEPRAEEKCFSASDARNSLTDGNQFLPCHRHKNRVTKSHTVILARIIHTQIAFLPSIWYTPSESTNNVLPVHLVIFSVLPSLFSFLVSVTSFPTFGAPAPILCLLPHLLISSLQLLTTVHSHHSHKPHLLINL